MISRHGSEHPNKHQWLPRGCSRLQRLFQQGRGCRGMGNGQCCCVLQSRVLDERSIFAVVSNMESARLLQNAIMHENRLRSREDRLTYKIIIG